MNLWIVIGFAAWFVVATVVGVAVGRAIHRADHREGTAEPGCCRDRDR